MVPLRLPPRGALVPGCDGDPLDLYYHPLTGWTYRQRLRLALDALGTGPFEALLEVGYGSGILLPELARRTKRLVAIDTHSSAADVARALGPQGVKAELHKGSVECLPYPDRSFGAVVCLSVLEHLAGGSLAMALGELERVAKAGAVVIVGFPVRNVVTDGFFRLLGFAPREIHPSSHREIIAAARDRFPRVRVASWPAILPLDLSLYVVCLGQP